MKNEFQRAAARMVRRAKELGLVSRDGKALVVDVMEELLAASQGYRNAHACRSALQTREAPVLQQEYPDETGSDYKLVQGRGCWLSMGIFSVHPYLTESGISVDVYAKGAEDDSIAQAWASDTDAEFALCESLGIAVDDSQQWALSQGCKSWDRLSAAERADWHRKFAESPNRAPAQSRQELLEELGYSFDSTSEVGPWAWHAVTSTSDEVFECEEDAVNSAWRDAAQQAMAIRMVSRPQWNALGIVGQMKLVKSLGQDS